MLAVGALCVLAVGISFIAQQSFSARAELIQRVAPDKAAADLFGDAEPTPVGSPQLMIVGDPKAFLPGTSSEGAKLVNEAYLRENNIYPLQLKTVDFISNLVKMAGIAGAAVSFLGAWLIGRKLSRA